MKKIKKGLSQSMVGLLLVASSLQAVAPVAQASNIEVKTISFSESSNPNQNQTITIPKLDTITDIKVDHGNVSYTRNGDNLTISVSSNTPTRQVWNATKFSKTGVDSKTSSANTFATTIPYSDVDGYSGTLSKSGTSTVISGTYTPADSKTITDSRSSSSNNLPSSLSYNSGGYTGTLAGQGVTTTKVPTTTWIPAETKTATDFRSSRSNNLPSSVSYNDGTYSGTLNGQGVYTTTGSEQVWVSGSNQYVSDYRTSSSNSFASSLYYNSGGYSGYLYPSGSSYVYYGSYTPSDTMYYSESRSGYAFSEWKCTSGGWDRLNSNYRDNSGSYTDYVSVNGYSGTISLSNGSGGGPIPSSSCPSSVSLGTMTTTYQYGRSWIFSGTLTRPASDTRVWRQDYSGTVSSSGYYTTNNYTIYNQNYSGTVTKPGYNQTTYSTQYNQTYSGTVTKPASDTRVWEQDYSGTVYKGGNDNYYSYNVEISYTTDTEAPIPATFVADRTSPTNSNVVVTVNYPSDAVTKQFRINGGTWTSYSSPITMTENGYVETRSIDKVGNISTVSRYDVSNIDRIAPISSTISSNPTSPTNQDVTISIAYSSDSVTKQYRIGTGTWTSYSSPFKVSSNSVIESRSYDQAGNVSSVTQYNVSNIDKVAPTTPSISPDVTTPTNENVVLTAIFSGDSSVKEYRINDGIWTLYSSPVTMTGNGTFEVRGKDTAGNYSAVASYSVSNIDKTAPANAILSPNTTSPTNQNVSVIISYPSDAIVKQYKIGSTGTWTTYTNPVLLSSNNTIYARSIDAVGNISAETNVVVSNIDKTSPTQPTISADVTEDTNGNVVLTATFSSDSSMKEYRVNGGTWTAYVNPVVMTANGTFEVRGKDVAGNYSAISSYEVSNIDKIPPANATLVADKTQPTNTDVKITITYPNDASVKQYKIGSTGTWTAYSTPVVVTSNNTVYARGIDAVGNVSNETNLVVSNIDRVAPSTPSVQADVTEPTNDNVTLTATFSTDSSVKEYRINGGTWTAYANPVVMTANGTFEVRGKDVAGNYSSIGSFEVSNIDKTAPIKATFVADKTSPTNTDVKVTISYPSDASVKQYKVGSTGTWTAYSIPVVVSENNTVYARSYDAVGNLSLESSYTVNIIDKEPPTVPTFEADKTVPTNTNVSVSITFSNDSVSKEYRVNNGLWTSYSMPVVMSENGTIEARGTDNANNVSSVSSYQVSNIDRVAPNKPTHTAINNQNKITLTGDADSTLFYQVDNGSWTKYTETIVTSDGTYRFNMKAIDKAGNESEIVSISELMYRDALTEAEDKVNYAENNITQENVNIAYEKVDKVPHDASEYQPLMERLDDLQALIEVQKAIEKATETRNEADVKEAQEKIDLLDNNNPVIIDILDDVKADFEVADILTLIAKERYDILLPRYEMSKVAYNSLVQTYFAIKYTGDSMYKMAKDKIVLVPATDKYYDLAHEQYQLLNIDYDEFVEERVATDAEIKAESSVQVMESKYDPTYALHTQELINAVEDITIREELQKRLDNAKAKYDASLLDKASQTAILAVEKAESTKQTYYVTDAYNKVNVLTDETLKSELTERLQTLEAQIKLDKQIADATRYVGLAEQYKSQTYIDSAQSKVSALPEGEVKTDLQKRLDVLKTNTPSADQEKIIKNATSYVSLAQTMKTQYYVDKAQGYVDQILDEVKKAELQTKLDAIVVK